MAGDEQLGPYRLGQEDGVFPLGQDSLFLGSFATVRRGERVCDLGCGGGVLCLLLAERVEGLRLTGVELDPTAAALAQDNFSNNSISGEVLVGDIRHIRAMLPAGAWDLVISNPPYFASGSGKSGGTARMEHCCTLDELCAAASYLLRNGGRFALVHRPQRLGEIFSALTGHGLEPKRMRLIQHSADTPPSAVLVEAVRQGRQGLAVLPTLLCKQDR